MKNYGRPNSLPFFLLRAAGAQALNLVQLLTICKQIYILRESRPISRLYLHRRKIPFKGEKGEYS
jgi:hypothetical protein